jgi:hypothetical protein
MIKLSFDRPLPERLPNELTVYATPPPTPAASSIRSIAAKWPGASASARQTVRQIGDWYVAGGGGLRILYNQLSGGAIVNRPLPDARAIEGSPRFPIEPDRIVALARAFLDQAKLVDDDASTLPLVGVNHLRRRRASADGHVGPEELLDAGVVFGRMIAKVPVVGPGGHSMVKLRPDGSIAGASRVFRPCGKKVGTVKVVPRAQALAELERRLRDRSLDGPVRILRAQFGYFEAGRSQRQLFFEPVFAFVFETVSRLPLKSAEIIPASKSPRELWWHVRANVA